MGKVKRFITGALAIALSIAVFSQMFYIAIKLTRDTAVRERMKTEEADTASSVVISCKAAPALAPQEASEEVGVARRETEDYWSTLYTDSRGATAYGWEIEECIRELMLEAGGESEEDIREHAAVYCKQLLYTQTVGGYDDWGLTLHEVVYSHGYAETWPNIWTEAAEPTDTVREIFWDVWENGYTSDFRVQGFRKDWYHSPLWAAPAFQIGRTCYSINIWQDFSLWGY